MKKFGKMLIVDDSEDMLVRTRSLFTNHFMQIDCERNPNLIPSYVNSQRYEIYILEMNFKRSRHNGNEGIYWMNRIFESHPEACVVLTTSRGSVETAVRAIKEGASDFIQKPWKREWITTAVLSACKPIRSDHRLDGKKAIDRRSPHVINIIGSSEPMKKLLANVNKVAVTDANVLITGENGTGKELVARSLHRQSNRAGEPFVSVDMGSLSRSLFESELFGHKKGAFTDAGEDRPGRFETAHKGTIFLDEIGNLPLSLQSKLLSVLQSRQVVRLGTNTPIAVDIRLVTATNMPLDRMVREGKFREDLLYRLNTITLKVPPLRERRSDIKLLFHHFKERFEIKYAKARLEVDSAVLDLLNSWHWPGNVRELEHAVEKAVIMCESGMITTDDIMFRRNGDSVLSAAPECYNLEKNEMRIINQAIERCSGNLSQASRILGITRKTLYNKINKYGI